MENMEIYNKGREVPLEAQKEFSNGRFSGTDINPMWRIKKLTELFGPVGIGWYYDVVSERAEEHGSVTIAVVDLKLYVKYDGEWSKPIYGTGGNVLLRNNATSDEGYKMALTDALSVACKALGIGADIYFDKDVTKYTAPAPVAPAPAPKAPVPNARQARCLCQRCKQSGRRTVVESRIAESRRQQTGFVLCDDCYGEWVRIQEQDAQAEAEASQEGVAE